MATEKDQVTTKLEELKVPPEVIEKIKTELGAKTVEDLAALTEADLIKAGMKPLPARKLLKEIVPPAQSAAAAFETASLIDTVLPGVPNNESWLTALKAGGVLKVDDSTVIAAVRAALAHRVNLFAVPDILVAKMEAFAESIDEQVNPEFFRLRNELTRRGYGEIFAAIPGLTGAYVTEARKKQLFVRIDEYFWPAITAFNSQLREWYDAWTKTGMNPAAMMAMFLSARGGAGVLPPAMMAPPDTGVLRDNAEAVADAGNRVFAGTGVQITAALAYEASQITETLMSPRLPVMIGAANRDQMLKQLGVAVPATYPRLELNLTKYVLSIIKVKDVPSGEEELRYFGALYLLGSSITWDLLDFTGKRPSGIGPRKRTTDEL